MKDEILSNLDNPKYLEKLFRSDKATFERSFNALYPDLTHNAIAVFWNERLNFVHEGQGPGSRSGKELVFVVIAAFIAGMIVKIPALFAVDENMFYPRNIGFIVFPALTAYFLWKNKLSTVKILTLVALTAVGLIFINALPHDDRSDTLILSCIHLPLFLWAILGYAFVGEHRNSDQKRLGYLRYNGDLLVLTTLIVISGVIMTAITINLFRLIGLDITKFYFENIALFGLPAAPILGTYLIQNNPQLVGKISPVIARIFSPLVLVMLVVYLCAIFYSGKDPYNDRDFLLIFNGLLIGVLAIIVFSVAETSKKTRRGAEIWVLFLLSFVTVIVNGIALSAIVFRIFEGGITPNRLAVLGSNVLMLINLVLVTTQLFQAISNKTDVTGVVKSIAFYLPVYCIWAIIVTFLFPLIFGFK
jgi:hypothetical protein